MAQGDTILSIQGLSIDARRDGAWQSIVDDIALTVRRGEICGLVGESGSGKSVAMMAAVGLASPSLRVSSGTVGFAGHWADADDQKRLRENLSRGIALLFQNARGSLNPFMRVGKQIDRVLALQPKSKRTDTRSELLRVVGLNEADIANKYPHEISGGQAQRVAMACALAKAPQLLIADEPTTALDVTTERELLRFLERICRERNVAVVLIAHNLSLVSEYCRTLSILHAGQIVESGDLRSIFAEPLHPYTQSLFAAIPDVDRPHELVPLAGSVWGGPQGIERCRFSHRCQFAVERCNQGRPPAIGRDGREVHCIRYESELQ